MSLSLNQSSPVAKTAFDSLQAKQSALLLGYSPLVVRNEEHYRDLLQRTTSDWKLRRQTPLVNAGYSVRVLAVSQAIDGFVQFHQHAHPQATLQIVFLGCGVDIIGLWAHSLPKTNGQIRIVELDMPSVCKTKKDLLVAKGLVVEMEGFDVNNAEETLIGRIARSTQQASTPDYYLAPVDLRNISALDQLIERGVISDPSVAPTLIVSELVMAYLPPDKTDQLLKWCAILLGTRADNAIMTLEPLGYDEMESDRGSIISVLEGYRRDYCRLFLNKMERGKSSTSKKDIPEEESNEENSFYPIGATATSVEERFQRAGFARVNAVSLGTAAAHTTKGSEFRIPEVFDEHASLVLHLQSYIVCTAFSDGSDGVLLRLMCPSCFAASEIPPVLKNNIAYTVMEAKDEKAMTDLFLGTYAHLFDTYPAIRKMVNRIMNNEFAISSSEGKIDPTESEITARYKSQQGCFFVAVRYPNSSTNTQREVVGCVGLRRCERKDDPNTLEVFRLAVHQDFRGQGIGRQLLGMAETFARTRSCPKLIANTLTCLESALIAYEACRYGMEKDSPLGSLTMRTYQKFLPADGNVEPAK